MAERLYTTHQVAELLGAEPSLVVDWMQRGWLPFQRLPDGPVRVSEQGLAAFLKRQGTDLEDLTAKPVVRPRRDLSAQPQPAVAALRRPEAPGGAVETVEEAIAEPPDDVPLVAAFTITTSPSLRPLTASVLTPSVAPSVTILGCCCPSTITITTALLLVPTIACFGIRSALVANLISIVAVALIPSRSRTS